MSEWESTFNLFIVKEDSNDLYKDLQLLTKAHGADIQTVEQILNPARVSDTNIKDPNFYRLILAVVNNFLKLSHFENFNEVLRFFLSLDSRIFSNVTPLSQKNMFRVADAFLTFVKNNFGVELPYMNLLVIYDNLIEILVQLKDTPRLMYISNSLLTLGSKCKQAKLPDNTHLDYYRKSFSIELALRDQDIDNSALLLKADRLCLALSDLSLTDEAFEVISDTIDVYSLKNSILEKVRLYPVSTVWESNEIQRILHLGSRLLIDMYPKIPVEFSNLHPEVEACLLEALSEFFLNSSRSNKGELMIKIMERIQKILDFTDFPLRHLRVLNSFFKSTGTCYEEIAPGITAKLLDAITTGAYNQDEQLSYLSPSIISSAAFSLVVSGTVPVPDQFRYLTLSVNNAIEALESKSNLSESLIADIKMLEKFLDLQGAHEKRAQLLRGVIKSTSYKHNRTMFSIFFHLNLISSLLALGYTGAAVRECEHIETEAMTMDFKPVEQVWLALRKCECYIAVSNLSQASNSFKKICDLIQADDLLKLPVLAGRPASEDRLHFQNRATLFAEICLALAKLHMEEGNVEYGINHAQKAIKFLQAFLKKSQSMAPHASNISLNYTWRMTSLLITCQTLTSMGFERLGIFRESYYYIGEASKVSRASECTLRLAAILSFESELFVRSSKLEQATKTLEECELLINSLNLQDLNVLHYAHSAILSLQRQRLFVEGYEYYELSDKIFADLKEKSATFSVKAITAEISRLSLIEKERELARLKSKSQEVPSEKPMSRTRNIRIDRRAFSRTAMNANSNALSSRARSKEVPTSPQQKPVIVSRNTGGPVHSDIYGVEVVWNGIVRSQVYSLGLQNNIDGAIALLDEQYRSAGTRDNVLLDIAKARNYYLLAKRDIEQDPVLTFVFDSAISIPSVRITHSIMSNYRQSDKFPHSALANLNFAKNLLLGSISDMTAVCTVIELNSAANLLNSILVLLSSINVVTEQGGHSGEHDILPFPNLVLHELARGFTLSSDRAVVKLQNNDFDWPSHTDTSVKRADLHSSVNLESSKLHDMMVSYKNKFLDNLPERWAVVSISICEETGSLVLTRFERGRGPLLISLPLNRHNSRDANEDFFSFDKGLSQLREIIDLSNATASVQRTSSIKTKENRQAWWKERYDLDQRLQELLKDAEHCWIGGFLGMFSMTKTFKHLMENFSNQFLKILRTHLPSRNWVMGGGRRRGVGSKRGLVPPSANGVASILDLKDIEIEVDPLLFELFVNLGEPETIEDPGMLEDLTYFILDTLQFHGERNAYDEIEIDQLLVDIEGLLKVYHNQVRDLPKSELEAHAIEHTVLILDKTSQAFPWESIPLLRGHSVTRVPSFLILSSLLQSINGDLTLTVERDNNNSHYVLNPGGDLPRTQERFQGLFERLSGWTGLTGRAPAEEEVGRMLESGDMFVYMGHGGGQQYIRSARIKGLERCCATLLLGCSSGALEPAGDYEPWGTPLNYLVAGCPMLVANMWDVTDKDIDKFSASMLERWGAFPPSNPGMKVMGIARAVRESRDECNLRFLNGAAPVVYGLPLSLVYK